MRVPPRRRQHRVVAAGRQVDAALGPAEPADELGLHGGDVDVLEVAGGAADPGAGGEVGVLAGTAVVAGGLDVPEAQPRRRAEVRRGHVVVDETVEHAALGTCAAERLAERGCDVGVHLDRRGAGGLVPVVGGVAGDELLRVLGGRTRRRGCVGGLDDPVDLLGARRTRRHRAGGHALGALVERDHGDGDGVHDAVGGQRVVGPAQVGAGRVADDRDAVVRARRLQGVLDELLRGARAAVHAAPSAVVLRTLTPRNRADGQPCETAATWPGWALPQLNAPPSSQVWGPPTASIERQKSVVVAW